MESAKFPATLILFFLVLGCSRSPSSPPTADLVVSDWGLEASGLRSRVKSCVLTSGSEPTYPTRINIELQIQNVSKVRKDVRVLAPISGEGCAAVMMEVGKEWQCIGNAGIAPKSKQAVFDLEPGEILLTDFSEGLTKADVNRLQQGFPLRCVLIAYGKGPYDPASPQTATFTISNIDGTTNKQMMNSGTNAPDPELHHADSRTKT